ncbi:hypothetical protein DXG01_005053 [Tephrocybe rancida]|nr:hypothetical protein DXG01_005053 [Tephrocybe rancida]
MLSRITESESTNARATHTRSPGTSSYSNPTSLGNELDRIRPGLSTTLIPKEIPARDTPRNKYISGLVDQAVKSLSEIWRPQDIPAVFVASAHSLVMGSGTYEASLILDPKPAPKKPFRNTQLPSPISPTTTTSPPMSSSPVTTTALSPSELDIASTSGSRGNLVPIKSFVHEVLRRSRTSGCVLQTALCYLEAIRCKVPDLVHAEQAGEGVQGEEDRSNWITPATAEELQREAEITAMSVTDKEESAAVSDPNLVATVRVDDISSNDASFTQSPDSKDDECPIVPSHQRLPPGPTLPSLPPLPSPLLCPRRAFLASLILASKFTQDKCYSNRAWAKLSGLPPREIGRCERALGEALDWRLWVGKQPSAAPPSPTPPALVPAPRTLARSQSESCLLPTTQGPFLIREEKLGHSLATDNCGLRRHSTLPADAFAASCSIRAPLGQVPWRTSMPLSSHCHSDIEEDDRMDSSSQATPTEPLLVMV